MDEDRDEDGFVPDDIDNILNIDDDNFDEENPDLEQLRADLRGFIEADAAAAAIVANEDDDDGIGKYGLEQKAQPKKKGTPPVELGVEADIEEAERVAAKIAAEERQRQAKILGEEEEAAPVADDKPELPSGLRQLGQYKIAVTTRVHEAELPKEVVKKASKVYHGLGKKVTFMDYGEREDLSKFLARKYDGKQLRNFVISKYEALINRIYKPLSPVKAYIPPKTETRVELGVPPPEKISPLKEIPSQALTKEDLAKFIDTEYQLWLQARQRIAFEETGEAAELKDKAQKMADDPSWLVDQLARDYPGLFKEHTNRGMILYIKRHGGKTATGAFASYLASKLENDTTVAGIHLAKLISSITYDYRRLHMPTVEAVYSTLVEEAFNRFRAEHPGTKETRDEFDATEPGKGIVIINHGVTKHITIVTDEAERAEVARPSFAIHRADPKVEGKLDVCKCTGCKTQQACIIRKIKSSIPAMIDALVGTQPTGTNGWYLWRVMYPYIFLDPTGRIGHGCTFFRAKVMAGKFDLSKVNEMNYAHYIPSVMMREILGEHTKSNLEEIGYAIDQEHEYYMNVTGQEYLNQLYPGDKARTVPRSIEKKVRVPFLACKTRGIPKEDLVICYRDRKFVCLSEAEYQAGK